MACLLGAEKGGGVNELALFAGAGGGILGSELLGIHTVCAVELEPYPASVLLARQNDGILPPFPVWDDVCTFDGRPWRGLVDVVSGGFPCQDISAAGKGAGIDGSRSGLWREMHRIINEVRPKFAFLENSPLLVGRGLARVLSDLAEIGYDAEWLVLGADDMGAPHVRKRIWILGMDRNANCIREEEKREISGGQQAAQSIRVCGDVADSYSKRKLSGTETGNQTGHRTGNRCKDLGDAVCQQCAAWRSNNTGNDRQKPFTTGENTREIPYANVVGLEEKRIAGGSKTPLSELAGDNKGISDSKCIGCRQVELENRSGKEGTGASGEALQCSLQSGEKGWWSAEPDVGRVAHGVAARVDRLKAIGNGQVPAVAAIAFRVLLERFTNYNPQLTLF